MFQKGKDDFNMKIWKLGAEVDKYDNLQRIEPWSWDETQSFDGRSKFAGWKARKSNVWIQKKVYS